MGNVAVSLGFSEVTAGSTLVKVWLIGLILGLLYVDLMVVRRVIWCIRGGSPGTREPLDGDSG